jgi:hypothetical protein
VTARVLALSLVLTSTAVWAGRSIDMPAPAPQRPIQVTEVRP